MSINLVLYILAGLGIAGLVVIIYRKIPSLANLSEEEIIILSRKKSFFQRVKEINWGRYWFNLVVSLEKFLRRIEIIFLKLDNILRKCIRWLRTRSQIISQRSKEWIKERESRRKHLSLLKKRPEEEISVKINNDETEKEEMIEEEESDDLSLNELEKPIKEEQKWIDLIVENPKNITAYKFLGLLYWKQHNYNDAKNSLEMSIKLGSKDRKVRDVLKKLKEMGIE